MADTGKDMDTRGSWMSIYCAIAALWLRDLQRTLTLSTSATSGIQQQQQQHSIVIPPLP